MPKRCCAKIAHMESREVGRRVVEARQFRGLTQLQLAQALGMDRTALAKIEGGQRRVTAVELGDIAHELGRRMEWFVLPRIESAVQHRNASEAGSGLAIDVVLETAASDVRLLLELGSLEFPAERMSMPVPTSSKDAEELGLDVRRRMGLAKGEPALALEALAFRAGLITFAEAFDTGADAASLIDGAHGVAVINSAMAVGRRRLALAHELGHFLVEDRYTTDFRIDTSPDQHESRIDRFARSLLLPAPVVIDVWRETVAEHDVRGAAVRLGSSFRVDMATLARRLKDDLRLIDVETASTVRSVRTTQADIIELDLQVPHDLEDNHVPRLFQQAVLRAYRAEDLSRERALGLLRDKLDAEDLPDLPALSEQNLWQVAT